MPQLNPSPWFLILMLSWVVFLTLLPPKVLTHLSPNEPAPQNTKKPQMGSWNWPWH
uniref:ATP synthase complex subunit 8 n=1 Tax=Chromis retrofasciata TaxID=229084 RepID=Q7Y6H4_9TELE|nr:ATP synthase 8 [Chromis retrofasciata]AAP75253.1 ATP synthase 8 [Chromis retrofasciata]